MSQLIISQIVAISAVSRAIGKNNQLLWHVPGDLRHFKETSMGKPIIMGRKTYDSVGFPLPGRVNIVVTQNTSLCIDGVVVVNDLSAALEEGRKACAEKNVSELIIAGGAEIYRQTLDIVDRIYLTEIDVDVVGDAYYPEIDHRQWFVTSEKTFSEEKSSPAYTIKQYQRIKKVQ